MLRLIIRLLVIGLIALGLFLFLGAQFFQNAGTALIKAVNGSAVQGQAQILPGTSGNSSNLQLTLQGLTPKSTYDITLDQGQCGGTLVKNVGPVTTDANGNVTKTVTIPNVSNQTQQTYWIDVHQGTSSSASSAACGQIQSNSTPLSNANVVSSTNSSSSSNSTGSSTITVDNPTGVSNTDVTPVSGQGNQSTSSTGLPNTGVVPGGSNSYDNYTFPRKY